MTDSKQLGKALPHQNWLVKVPQVTAFFWIIKVLATTVGETFADYLNTTLGLGLTGTTVATVALLALVLVFQFRAIQYKPALYWLAVVLISIAGTLFTDNLTDNLGVSLLLSSTIFSIALATVFFAWHRVEGSLSIHSIYTPRREAFYWIAILLTFALGTSTGDLMAEKIGFGYGYSFLIFAVVIALIALMWRFTKLNGVLAFWSVYVITRPLGASTGDFLSQPKKNGGLGLGTTNTSLIFLMVILALVVYLTRSRKDAIKLDQALQDG